MSNVLDLIVFTPKALIPLGRAMKRRVAEFAAAGPSGFPVTVATWDEDAIFFDPGNEYPLNECIRKLHSYDGAILILGPGERRPSGNAFVDAGGAIARVLRQILGLPRPVNPNVLIEIGAAMARFGRNRVFLVEPKSKNVEIPSYFYKNNAVFLEYDDGASGPDAAVADAARGIVAKLKELGQSAYYSDLPSFGLAHGYLNNFLKPAMDNVERGAAIVRAEERKTFASAACIIAYAEGGIVRRDAANERLGAIGLVEASIEANDGRAISFRTLPDFLARETLYIVDVPSNLVPSRHAIDKIDDLWIERAAPASAYKLKLEQREIANFFRYLDILRNDGELPPSKIRRVPVPALDDLTLALIEAQAD